jgi:type I restriction enzyme M protein
MNNEEQQFLNDLDKRLWTAADKLRANLNPGDYMHVVLGLVFLKYVSDAFKERREELKAAFADPANDYYLGPDGAELIEQELEARDYYTEKNVFWVPALARWDFLKASAKVAIGTKLEVKNGKTFEYKFTGIGRLLDDALEAVEKENPKLKNVLDKSYARWRIDEALPGLIDLLGHRALQATKACTPRTSSATSTNTSSASSPLPPASAAASSTRPRASSA